MHCGTKQKQPYFFEGEDELYLEEFYDARSNGYSLWALVVIDLKRNFDPKLGQGLSKLSNVPTSEMKCLAANVVCG
jgi:hypothetical protein